MNGEQIEELVASMPFVGVLGIEIPAASADEVQARLAWREDLCTAAGLMHGGALMSLADTAGAVCAFLNLPEGARSTATIESKTNLLRGVTEGTLTATSRPLPVGRQTIVVETEVAIGDGRLAAKTTQTQAVLR